MTTQETPSELLLKLNAGKGFAARRTKVSSKGAVLSKMACKVSTDGTIRVGIDNCPVKKDNLCVKPRHDRCAK